MRVMRVMLLVALVLLPAWAWAADSKPAPALTVVSGKQELPFTRTDLEKLGPVDAEWTLHSTKLKVRGVSLDAVLEKVGFTPGPMSPDVPKAEKRSGWKKILIASAADGFSAVFSCAELMPSMGATRALLIWEVDGKPLPPDQGPFRIVVLTDREPSRAIYAVNRLDIVDARTLLK